jgi:hypothetical protein
MVNFFIGCREFIEEFVIRLGSITVGNYILP